VLLAANVGLAGFALRRERIEFLLEPFLGGFAGVDRATSAARVSSRHCRRRPLHGAHQHRDTPDLDLPYHAENDSRVCVSDCLSEKDRID
jgi:hypothetical protein